MRKLLFVLMLVLPLQAQNWSGILDPTTAIDWATLTGIPGGIPTTRTQCGATIAAGASNSTIQTALTNCASSHPVTASSPGDGGYVLLGPGTFAITTLSIPSNVTLRGSGTQSTILQSGNATIITMGSGGPTLTTLYNITSGATRGSTSITVAQTTGMAVGRYLLVSELNNTGAPYYVVVGDCSYCDGNGGTRLRGQIVEITSMNGNTIGITPLYSDYTLTPAVTPFTASVKYGGLESVQLYTTRSAYSGGAIGNVQSQTCAYCWIKGIESNYASDDHVEIIEGFRDEIRDSYFSNCLRHQPGNSEGDVGLFLKTSGVLVENNISERVHDSFLTDWGTAGNVFAYNYGFGGFATDGGATTNGGWNAASHGAHPTFTLSEGNVGDMWVMDSIHGSGSHGTFFRNWMGNLTTRCSNLVDGRPGGGYSCASTTYAGAQMVGFLISGDHRTYNVVGNVGGSALAKSVYSEVAELNNAAYNWNGTTYDFVYGSAPNDALTLPTSLVFGNYSNANNTLTWERNVPAGYNPTHPSQTLPASFIHGSRPPWWGATIPWPAIGPDVTGGTGPGGHVYSLTAANPAQACYNATTKGADGIALFDPTVCYAAGSPTYSILGTISGAGGNAATVNLTGTATASTTADGSGNFTLSGLANGPYTVTPSKATYTFAPANRSVTISGADQTAQNFTATGTAAVTFTPSSWDFGSEGIGLPSSGKVIQLSNTGTGQLTGISHSFTGTNIGDFSKTTTCGATLNAAANCNITVTFTPTAAGARSANLSLTDNLGTQTAVMSGTGYQAPVPACTPTSGNYKGARLVNCTNQVPAATMCWKIGSAPATNGAGTCTIGSGTFLYTPSGILLTSTGVLYVTGTQAGNTDNTVNYSFTVSPTWTAGWIMQRNETGTTKFGSLPYGPPLFTGSTTSIAASPVLAEMSMPSINSTAYAYSAPSDFYYPLGGHGNCYTALTDATSRSGQTMGASISGGGGNVMSDTDRDYIAMTDTNGNLLYAHVSYTPAGCMQLDSPLASSLSGGTSGGGTFSRVTHARTYKVSGKAGDGTHSGIYQETLSGTSTVAVSRTKIFDYNRCPGVDGTQTTQGGNGNLSVDSTDRYYATTLNFPPATSGQDGAHWAFVWDRTAGACTSYYTGPVAPGLTLTSVANASGGSTVYTGTITNGDSSAFDGGYFTVAGFTNSANNGTFLATASTGATITLSNASGAAETHAATVTSADNPANGNIWGWCNVGTEASPIDCSQHGSNPAPLGNNRTCLDSYGVHNSNIYRNGLYLDVVGSCDLVNNGNAQSWKIGFNDVQTCNEHLGNCGGHGAIGYSIQWHSNIGITVHPQDAPQTFTTIRPTLGALIDAHGGTNWFGALADTAPFMAASMEGVSGNLCTGLPYCREILAERHDGAVVRFGPNFHVFQPTADLGPIPAMTQDGYCILFNSNWNLTRGLDPTFGRPRSDVFALCNLQ